MSPTVTVTIDSTLMKIYVYHKCSTCRKALQWLDRHGLDYTDLPIVESPPSADELHFMLDSYDGMVRKLFNTSGLLYRGMKLKDRLPRMTVEDSLTLLQTNGMLIKRPFLLAETFGLVGFREAVWGKRLLPDG